jgi:C-1 hydroxylase
MCVDAMIPEGDGVAVRLTSAATQTGPFMDPAPTGRRYEIGEIHTFALRDGRVSEHWHKADVLGMLRQLGASPGDAAGGGEPACSRRTAGVR